MIGRFQLALVRRLCLVPFILMCIVVHFPSAIEALDESDFHTLTTDHFVLHANTRLTEIYEVGRVLEDCFSLVASTFPFMTAHVPLPLEVLYVSQVEDFNELTSYQVDLSQYRFDEDLPFGFFQRYPDKARIILTRTYFEKYIPTLFGEMTRLFITSSIAQPPIWIEQGFSRFYASTKKTSEGYDIGRFKKEQIADLRAHELLTLSRLLKVTSNSSILKGKEEERNRFINHCALFINFLLYFKNNQYQTTFFTYLLRLTEGVDNDTAFLSAFTEGIIPLHENFKDYPQHRTHPYTIIKPNHLKHVAFTSPQKTSRAEVDRVIGDEYLRHHNLVKAQQYFSRGKANDQNSAANILGMAQVFYYQHQHEKALQELQRVRELAQKDNATLRDLAFFLVSIAQKDQALQVFKKLVAQWKPDAVTLKQAAQLAQELNDQEATLLFLQKLFEVLPDHPIWTDHLIKAFHNQQLFVKAAAYSLRLYLKNPNQEKWLLQFIKYAHQLPEVSQRISVLLQARQKLPQSTLINKELGAAYRTVHNSQAALSYYRRYLEAAPEDKEVRQIVTELEAALIRDKNEVTGQEQPN